MTIKGVVMTQIQSVGNNNANMQPQVATNSQPKNVIRYDFRPANQDQFVRQQSPTQQPPVQQTRRMMQPPQLQQMLEAQKKEKAKQNLSWGLGIVSSVVIIAFFVSQFMMSRGKNLPGSFKLSNLTFDDLTQNNKIGNLKDTKTYVKEVKDFFIDLLSNANIDEKALKKAGFTDEALPNAALILGPPGTGKTEVVKMFSKALGGEYCEIKLGEVANSFVDGTATQTLRMFEELVQKAKAAPDTNFTIFFDEIDGFARKLGSIGSHNEHLGKNRQSFIKGLDMLKELKNVRIFGATNVPITEVDDAVISRLAKNITIDLPQKEQAMEGLKFHLRNVGVGNFYEAQASQIDKFIQDLCEKKCSFRDISNIVQDARAKFAKDVAKNKDYDMNFDIKYLEQALKEKGLTSGELAEVY